MFFHIAMCRSGTHTHTYNKIKVWFLKLFALLIYIINIFPKGALNSSSSFHISSVSNLLKLGLKKVYNMKNLKWDIVAHNHQNWRLFDYIKQLISNQLFWGENESQHIKLQEGAAI